MTRSMITLTATLLSAVSLAGSAGAAVPPPDRTPAKTSGSSWTPSDLRTPDAVAPADNRASSGTFAPRDLRTPDAVDGSRHIAPDAAPAPVLPAPGGGLDLLSTLVGLAISFLLAAMIVTGRTRRRRVPAAG